jgi:hypothetical protein
MDTRPTRETNIKILSGIVVAAMAMLFYKFWRDKPKPKEPDKKSSHPWGDLVKIDRIIILGMPFTGKTYFAAKLTKSADRVLFFDVVGDYRKAANSTEFTIDELEANPNVLDLPRFKISVRPSDDDERAIVADLERMLALAREKKNMVVVLDEVGDYSLLGQRALTKVFRNGRHYGLATVLVSQVATDIPKTCRRISTRLYSFLQEDPSDLAALEEKAGSEFAAKVKSWKEGDPPAVWQISTLVNKNGRMGSATELVE